MSHACASLLSPETAFFCHYQNRDQHQNTAIHGLPVESDKRDWLKIQNEYSTHAQNTGSGQRLRRRILGAVQKNRGLSEPDWQTNFTNSVPKLQRK